VWRCLSLLLNSRAFSLPARLIALGKHRGEPSLALWHIPCRSLVLRGDVDLAVDHIPPVEYLEAIGMLRVDLRVRVDLVPLDKPVRRLV
jgi:hypothetical protein